MLVNAESKQDSVGGFEGPVYDQDSPQMKEFSNLKGHSYTFLRPIGLKPLILKF